jgi:hypothetical protein
MRSNLGFILDRQALNLAESGTDIVLHWQTLSGGTADPVTGATVGAVRTAQSQSVKAFVHYVNIAQSTQRIFSEIEKGDCILDLDPAVALEGKDGLQFEISGERWVQKEFSEKLAKSWDVLMQGQRIFRPVLLRKAT